MNNELYHHGVKGMKWGVRRYQNPDGSLTEAGRKRYAQSIGNQTTNALIRGSINRWSSDGYKTIYDSINNPTIFILPNPCGCD